MGQLRIRGTSAELPVFDFDVRTVTSLSDSVSGFEFGAASVRALDIGHVGLQDGRIRAVRAERFGVTAVDVRSVEFTGCVLRGALFDGCDLAPAGFGPGSYRGCDLRGNDLSAVTGVHTSSASLSTVPSCCSWLRRWRWNWT